MQAIRSLQTSFSLLMFMGTASAQIPNGSFENWVNLGGVLEPVGWLTYNDVSTVGGSSVQQGTPGNPGNSHVVITSRAATGGGLPIQGWISAGVDGINDGFPLTTRPVMLTGQWQYGIQLSDTGQVTVALSKWNSLTSSTDGIAFGSVEITGALSNWQSFSVSLTYISSDFPDTAYIQIVSSISFASPVVGSFMKVDDLAFTGSVGVHEEQEGAIIAAFPNPGTDHFSMSLPPGQHTITFFDAVGRAVLHERSSDERLLVGTAHLPSGIYVVRVDDDMRPLRWVKQ